MKSIEFTVYGIIKGGKNHVNITRTGQRYPNKAWAQWRNNVVCDLRQTMAEASGSCVYFDCPCRMRVFYWAGDKRRRDVPAMIDALFHCFEHAGLVKDDALIRQVEWFYYGYDKNKPRCEIAITEL
jgi:Holliday junction resolvase RusA-like endonuclease